jgi:hypothetical protein
MTHCGIGQHISNRLVILAKGMRWASGTVEMIIAGTNKAVYIYIYIEEISKCSNRS